MRIQYLQHTQLFFLKKDASQRFQSLSRNDRINKIPTTKLIQCGPPSVQTQSINPGAVRSLWVRFLNGGLGEGDSQVLVASHVVVVKVNQGLDGLLHC